MNRTARLGTALLVFAPALLMGQVERVATHIVRPGETLRGITRQHLGTELRWRENLQLNPELENPDVLTPGQRIRILVSRDPSRLPTARVIMVSGDVDERPAPVDWLGARDGDLLLEKDGLRTGAGSSSVLQFTDGTELALIEGSRVILARAGRSLTGVDERSVEILEGQAELKSVGPAAPLADIEIVIGGTVAKPQVGEGGELQARAKMPESGGAAVMMYEGNGEVEAAGQKVAVERGMGTAVPDAGPPAPPEKLLPAPRPLRPEPAARVPYPDPEFAWDPVERAASYTLELCHDAQCAQPYRRVTGLTDSVWRADSLRVAPHHWRVSAVSESGLDGYPSTPMELVVLTDQRDVEGPTAEFELEGPSVERAGRTFYAPSAEVGVEVNDEPAGVDEWRVRIDGRPAERGALTGGWKDGEHAVEVIATDRLGNEATRQGPRFRVDAEPPKVLWEVGGERALAELLESVDRPERWQRRWRWWQKRVARSLRRRGAEPTLWALVAWNTDAFTDAGAAWSYRSLRWHERRRNQTVSHAGGAPAMLIVAPRLRVPGSDQVLGNRMLVVRAVDDGSGTRELSLKTRDGELEVETVDRLGNRRIESAVFEPVER